MIQVPARRVGSTFVFCNDLPVIAECEQDPNTGQALLGRSHRLASFPGLGGNIQRRTESRHAQSVEQKAAALAARFAKSFKDVTQQEAYPRSPKKWSH